MSTPSSSLSVRCPECGGSAYAPAAVLWSEVRAGSRPDERRDPDEPSFASRVAPPRERRPMLALMIAGIDAVVALGAWAEGERVVAAALGVSVLVGLGLARAWATYNRWRLPAERVAWPERAHCRACGRPRG